MGKRRRSIDEHLQARNRPSRNYHARHYFGTSSSQIDSSTPSTVRSIIHNDDGNVESFYTPVEGHFPQQRPQTISIDNAKATAVRTKLADVQRSHLHPSLTQRASYSNPLSNSSDLSKPHQSISAISKTHEGSHLMSKPDVRRPDVSSSKNFLTMNTNRPPSISPMWNDHRSQHQTCVPHATFSSNKSRFKVNNHKDDPAAVVHEGSTGPSHTLLVDATNRVETQTDISTSDTSSSGSDSSSEDSSEISGNQTRQHMPCSKKATNQSVNQHDQHRNSARSSTVISSREGLRIAAEKTINTTGDRIKEADQRLGERFATGLEAKLLTSLYNVIPGHVLDSARQKLTNERNSTQSGHHKSSTKNTTTDNNTSPYNEAVVLQAAKDLIVRLSVQKIAGGNSKPNAHQDKVQNGSNQQRACFAPQEPTTVIQNELARIVRERDERISMLELELYNHRHR